MRFNLGKMFGDSICNNLPCELNFFIFYTLIELIKIIKYILICFIIFIFNK